MTDDNKIEINPMVALAEAQALSEFYRNRTLVFHQRLFDAAQPVVEPEAPVAPEAPPTEPEAASARPKKDAE